MKRLTSITTAALLALASPAALADPPVAIGQQLTEHSGGMGGLTHRLACGSEICVWRVDEWGGGCSEEDCMFHHLVATGLDGKAIGSFASFKPAASVRLVGARQVELVTPVELIPRNPGGSAWDPGFDPTLMERRLITFPAEEIQAPEEKAWSSPARYARLRELLGVDESRERPSLPGEVAEASLAKAAAACNMREVRQANGEGEERGEGEAPETREVHRECHKDGTCLSVLSDGTRACAVLIGAGGVKSLGIDRITSGDRFFADGPRLCFEESMGGIRGGPGNVQCVSREHPDRMAFLETAGLHLESGRSYPVRTAASLERARSLAPVVHAETAAHVRWGLGAWKGAKDASLAWQAVWLGDRLHVHAEVIDDAVAPLGGGAPVNSDHLELELVPMARPGGVPREIKGARLKLAVLLAANGKAQPRLWTRGEAEVDEAYAAEGTWARTQAGYAVDLAIPLASWRDPGILLAFSLLASDADAGKQKTLIGTDRGSFRFWRQWPPAIEEYARVGAAGQ